jgi:primosomal protein N' (replication factor Y)
LGNRCRELLIAGGPYKGTVEVMGPIEAPIARIAGQFRWQIIVKSADTGRLHRFVRQLTGGAGSAFGKRHVRVIVDVDPFFLM